MIEFLDDDPGFLRWLDTHPHGYVLNTPRHPSASYLMLHRALCGHLQRRDARQTNLTSAYMKVCSSDVAGLQRWADRHFAAPSPLTRCRACKP
jgi:hypothetical protein